MDMKKLLESIDSMTKAAKKSTGPKFPGYWKGTDSASKSKTKMVGGAEESIIKDLHNTAKQKVTEWALEEAYRKFNEVDLGPVSPEVAKMSSSEINKQIADMAKSAPADGVSVQKPEYKGIDPVVRQRMGMQPATQDEIRSYLDKNPAGITTSTGELVKSGTGQPIVSGGQRDVAKAADLVSPDRSQAVARSPGTTTVAPPVAQPAPAQPAPAPQAPAPQAPAPQAPAPQAPSELVAQPIPDRKFTPHGTLPPVQSAAPAVSAPKPVPAMPKNPVPGSWQDIWKQNPDIKNPNVIYPGQRIKLPDSDEDYVVQKGDTLGKISQLYKGGEIGGRITSSDEPGRKVAPPAQSRGGSGPGSAGFAAQDSRRTDRSVQAAPSTPAPAAPTAPAAPPAPVSTTTPQQTGHLPGTMLFRSVKDPSDPSKTINVSFTKQADGSYKSTDGRFHVRSPGNIQSLDSSPSHFSFTDAKQADRYTRLDPGFRTNLERASRDSGIPITVTSSARTAAEQEKLHQDYRAGRPGVYGAPPRDPQSHSAHAVDALPHQITALRDWLAKNDPKGEKYNLGFVPNDPVHVQHGSYKPGMRESRKDKLIGGQYQPDEFDQMVNRVKQIAHQQEKKHGPVDLAKLAQRLRDLDKKEKTNEVEDPAVNMQDPDVQRTSQTSPNQDPAAVKQQQIDQQVDVSTAKSTMSGLKTALGPRVDTNALASAVTKISDGKPLTGPEASSMSALTPLISKAAETPQTAMALKTALSNAAMLAKQGK